MKTQTKSRIRRPGIMTIVIAAVLIGLGIKGIIYISGYLTETDISEAAQRSPVRKSGSASTRGAEINKEISDYQMVAETNLFRPLGWEKVVEKPETTEPVVRQMRPQRRPETTNDLALTGIVNLNGELVALVEDTARKEPYFLRQGDRLKNYVVESISGDSITLADGDTRLTTTLGSKTQYNSDGQILNSQPVRDQVVMNDADTGESIPASEDSSTMSLIERMKARRRRELGQE